MSDTKLKGRPVLGDRIKWARYNMDMTGSEFFGTVIECTGELSKVQTRDGNLYLVPHLMATVVINNAELVDYLASQLKMITTLDQGCGGAATPEECWRQARCLALDAIARLV